LSSPPTGDTSRKPSRRQRLLAPDLSRPTVDPLLESWTLRGGSLSLVGPSGSGRTRLLRRALEVLDARGATVVELWPGRFRGASLVAAREQAALHDPLPTFHDAARRGRTATHQLLTRLRADAVDGVWVVADDIDQLLAESLMRSVLLELEGEPDVHMLTAGAEPLPGCTLVPLTPLPIFEYADLEAIVGGDVAWMTDALHPGPALATLIAHPNIGPADGWSAVRRMGGLSETATQQLRLASLSCVPLQIDAAACAELVERDLVVAGPRGMRVASPTVATELAAALGAGTATHAALLKTLPTAHPAQVPHAVAVKSASDEGLQDALSHLASIDPVRAARWGRLLLRSRPRTDIALTTAAAALLGGRRPEAIRGLLSTAARLPDPEAASLFATAGLLWFLPPIDLSAARQCLSAVHALAEGPLVPPRTVRVLHGRLQAASGSQAAALARLQAAADTLPDLDGPLRVPLVLLEADGWAELGRLDDVRRVLDLLAAIPDSAAREQAARAAARHLHAAGRVLDASNALVRAASVDRERPDPAQVQHFEEAARLAMEGGDPGAAIAHLTAALSLATGPRPPSPHVARLRPRLAATLLEVGRYDDALEAARACWNDIHVVDTIRHQAATVGADVALALEDSQNATLWLDRAEATLPDDAPPSKRIRIERRRCEVALRTNAPDTMSRIKEAGRAAHRAHAGQDLSRLRALQAVALAQAHRQAEVGPTLERAMRPLRDAGAGRLLAEVRIWGGQAWLITGDLEEARKVLGRALVWAEETGHLHLRNRAADLLDSARPPPGTADARLDRVVDLTTSLARERCADRVRQKAIAACRELLHAERVFVLSVREGEAHVDASWNNEGRSPGAPSSSVVRAILSHGREIAVSDIGERADLRAQTSIVAQRLRSVMCVPMHRQGDSGMELAGLLYVDSPARTQRESERGLRVLRALAAHTSVAIHASETLAHAEERARRASELIHDLRSPAASLSMAGQELGAAEDVPVWVQETGRLIEQQAGRLLRVAEQHLSGVRALPSPIRVSQFAADLGRALGPLARSQGRALLVEVSHDCFVWAINDDLQRIVTNLIHNAIRHTPVGTAVRVRSFFDEDQNEVVLTVCDEGAGLAEDQQALIFDSGIRGQRGGHGLGLSIARRLARLWDGDLLAGNNSAGGGCFSLRLPVWQPET